MYVLFRKIDALAPNYDSCYQFQDKREAELKYQELLEQYSPRCLDLVELSEVQLVLTVDSNGNTTISNLEFPIATEEQMGIIRLATALQANWENPQNYVDGMPVSVPPSLIKTMIEAGLATAGLTDATTTQKGVVRLATEEEADYDNPSNGEDNIAVMQPVATKGMIDTAAEYETEYSPEVSNIKEALNDIYTQLNYVPLVITSFTIPTTMYERGLTPTINCSWSYNKNQDIVWQKLNNIDLVISLRSYSLQDIAHTQDIVLAGNDGTNTVTKSIRITFTNQIYYGAALEPASITSDWVKQLSDKKLSTTYKGTYHYECGNNLYAFIAIPSSYNPPAEAYISSWLTELDYLGEIDFVSDYHIESKYKVFRTSNPGLGSFDMELK